MIYGPYALQYVRNTLQLNQGPRLNANDSTGEPVFAEIGFYAGGGGDRLELESLYCGF